MLCSFIQKASVLGIYSHWNSDLEMLMPPPLKIKVIILTFQIRVLSSKR